MELTQLYIKSILHYDPDTGIFTWVVSRGGTKAGQVAGSFDKRGYLTVMVHGKNYMCHRLAFLYMTGRWPNCEVDHINGAVSDNRFLNLRDVSRRENSINAKLNKNSTTGIMGVSWYKSRSKWTSRIMIHGKNKNMGYFASFFEACCARKSAENSYGFHPNHGRSNNGLDDDYYEGL